MTASVTAIVVCGSVNFFADNIKASCADCRRAIVHRPNVPEGIKLCVRCAAARVANDAEPPIVKITEEQARDLALYYAQHKDETDG